MLVTYFILLESLRILHEIQRMLSPDETKMFVSHLFPQEAAVLGSVGSISCPLPVYRFLDDRIRRKPKSPRCTRSPLKPPLYPFQLLPTLHTAAGADEEQQVI